MATVTIKDITHKDCEPQLKTSHTEVCDREKWIENMTKKTYTYIDLFAGRNNY